MNSLFFFALPKVGYFCIQDISGQGGLRPFEGAVCYRLLQRTLLDLISPTQVKFGLLVIASQVLAKQTAMPYN
jgi:hypothetical protein